MSRQWTHKECFAFHGVRPTNIRYSWSALDERANKVVHTFWTDGFSNMEGRPFYRRQHRKYTSPAYKEFARHMHWALEHCDGVVSVIMASAESPTAVPRRIAACWPVDMKMRITKFDATTGELVAEPTD